MRHAAGGLMIRMFFKVTTRNLLKHKTYSLINILGLTLGLFSSILILLFVRDELSYDTFHENADRIYRVVTEAQNAGGTISELANVAAPWGPMLQQELPEVEESVRFRRARRSLLQVNNKTFYESGGLYTDPEALDIFSFKFLLGNPQTALAAPDAVVLTESMARKLFGELPAIGQSLTMDSRLDLSVLGVVTDVPHNSHFSFDFLLPYEAHARTHSDWQTDWGMFNYYVYLLLAPGSNPAELERKMPKLFAKHVNDRFASEIRPYLQSITSIHLHSDLSGEFESNGSIAHVYILSAIAILVLLVACVNFINLATARAGTRAREVGMRKVVGAGRYHLIWHFMSEALFVGLIALLIGIGLIELSLPLFNSLFNKELALDLISQPDLIILILGITIVTALLAGGYPAFVLSQFQPVKILKSKTAGSSTRSKLRRALVIAQFAVSSILLVGAMTIYRQLQFMTGKDPGFKKEQIIAIPIDDRRLRFDLESTRVQIAGTEGVLDVAITSGELAAGDWAVSVNYPGPAGKVEGTFRMLSVTHNFLDVMEIPVVSGRGFSMSHTTDAENAVIVNERAAGLIDDAIGKTLVLEEYGRTATIVGVARDFHFRSMHESIKPMILFIDPGKFNYFYVRLESGSISDVIANLEEAWTKLSPSFPFTFTFLDEQMESLYGTELRLSKMVSYFTGFALIVACIGLLGLASFMAERRTKEIGVRKVLGASVPEIVSMISKEFAWLVLLANLVAWPIAWLAMNQWLQNFAYRIDVSWWVFVAAGGSALVVALLSVSIQAVRAALANPVDALRYE